MVAGLSSTQAGLVLPVRVDRPDGDSVIDPVYLPSKDVRLGLGGGSGSGAGGIAATTWAGGGVVAAGGWGCEAQAAIASIEPSTNTRFIGHLLQMVVIAPSG